MIISESTKQAKNLGDLFETFVKRELNVSKNMAKTF